MSVLSDDMRKEAAKLSKWGRPTAVNLLSRGADELDKRKARIAALEAQVRAADALAAWANAISERKASPVTGGRLILERDIVGLETSLDAYRATKEGGA